MCFGGCAQGTISHKSLQGSHILPTPNGNRPGKTLTQDSRGRFALANAFISVYISLFSDSSSGTMNFSRIKRSNDSTPRSRATAIMDKETISPPPETSTRKSKLPSPPRRRRYRSASPVLRRLPDFLAKLPVESSQSRRKRCSTPPPKVKRSNSFTKLFPHLKWSTPSKSPNDSSSWANESIVTEATCLHSSYNSSFSVAEEEDWAVRGFLQELDKVISVQQRDKEQAEERIVEGHELAWARFDNGNETGALLSMRQAHKWVVRVQYLDAAIQKLQFLRNEVVMERDAGFFGSRSLGKDRYHQPAQFDTTMDSLRKSRRSMTLIIAQLRKSKLHVEMPSDVELIDQLLDIMEAVEI